MADRTIVLAQNKRHAVRGLTVVTPQEFSAYQEDDDDLTYIVDMSNYLDGATISSVVRTPVGVTVSNTSNTTTRLTQRLKGFGYVDINVTSSSGEVEQFRITIQPRGNSAFFLSSTGSVPQNTAQMWDVVSDVIAANIDSGISWIRTQGYYAVGDGGGALYSRVYSAPSHNGYITSNSGTSFWVLEENQNINVRRFGATGDGTTDDTTSIGYAISYLRAKVNTGMEIAGSYALVFPHGDYRVTASLNLTNIKTRSWGIRGPGRIVGDFTSAYAIIDLSRSRWCRITDLFVYTAGTPGMGIFIGRDTSGNVADVIHFDNVTVYGTFSIAAFYNYASEDFTGIKCSFVNLSSSASTYCAVFDGTNSLGATSAYQTIPANTSASFNDVYCVALDCRKPNGGPAVFLRRTAGLEFQSGYVVATNDSAIVVSSDAFGQQHLRLDVHCETAGLTSCVRFDGNATQTINGFYFQDYAPQASDEIFEAGSGVTSVTLADVEITVNTYGVTPTNGLFSDKSKFTIRDGRISSPTKGDFRAVEHPGWVTGRYYYFHASTTASSIAAVENRMYFYPVYAPGPRDADRIGVFLTAAASDATAQIRMGIYRNDNGVPGTLLLDAGLATIGTSSGQQTATISQTIPEGWHWLAVIMNRNGGAGTFPSFRNYANDAANQLTHLLGDADMEVNTPFCLMFADPTVASWASFTLPTIAPSVTYSAAGVSPVVGLRAA